MTLTVTLPPRHLARDVTLDVHETEKGWSVVAFDVNAKPWPIRWKGLPAPVAEECPSALAAETMLKAMGHNIGDKIFAVPSERF